MARQSDPTHSLVIDVRQVGDFWEMRDKGGIPGRINLRVFYSTHNPSRTIVILGVIKKENEGSTPVGTVTTTRRRLRLYRELKSA